MRWDELKPELLAPIAAKRSLVGLLAVGPKLSGLDYTSDDRAMLMTLANQTAVAVENARLYAAVQAELAEREAAESRLLESLHEKEVLLKEIHHRVKNNLQVIYSLLSLQTRVGQRIRLHLDVLLDSQNRIRSMALIHEKLYQSADLANIDFSEYLGSLAGHLCRSYADTGCQVKLQVNAAHVRLGIDAAVPCGLIASELISNALKHAFVGRELGLLSVAVRNSETGAVELVVADDGVGVASDAAGEGSSSLGMQLVRGLVRQLDGSLTVENGQGGALRSFIPAKANDRCLISSAAVVASCYRGSNTQMVESGMMLDSSEISLSLRARPRGRGREHRRARHPAAPGGDELRRRGRGADRCGGAAACTRHAARHCAHGHPAQGPHERHRSRGTTCALSSICR